MRDVIPSTLVVTLHQCRLAFRKDGKATPSPNLRKLPLYIFSTLTPRRKRRFPKLSINRARIDFHDEQTHSSPKDSTFSFCFR